MGNDLYILLAGTIGMFIIISTFVAFAYFYQKKMVKRERELREIEKLLQNEELKSAYALLEGKDNERQRIASDLHDRMGGQLSTIKIYLDLLEQSEMNADQTKLVSKLQKSTDLTIEEVRAVSHDLGNSTLDNQGFKKAIEQLVEVINESKKIKVTSSLTLSSDLPPSLSREMYQVIQELMTNTLRHSNASQVTLDVNYIGQELNIIFEDNGVGFEQKNLTDGLGLKSIRLRVERHNGVFTVDAQTGRGAAFIIEINLADDKN